MSWMRSMGERLRGFGRRGRIDAEMDEEIRFHIERETEKNLAAGMSAEEARRKALIDFGGVERFREQVREETGVRPLEDLARDLRFALRTLGKAPGVVAVTVLSLGLGIAASSTVFSMASSMLFGDPGPVRAPEEIVAVYASGEGGRPYGEVSMPDFLDISAAMQTLETMAAHRVGVLNVGDGTDRDRLLVELVTADYFRALGVTPILGRAFLPEEVVLGKAQRLLVLSYDAWIDRFNGDRGALGRVMVLDGQPFTVVGVAPRGLGSRMLAMRVDGWVPLGIPGGTYRATPERLQDRAEEQFMMLGRLRPGKTLEEAQSEASLLAGRLHQEYGRLWEDGSGRPRMLTVLPEAATRMPPDGRAALLGLAGFLLLGAFLILGLACSNVASLLLARAFRRSREMAIRISLGAGRARLVRMLLVESLLLALAGGVLGLGLSFWITGYLEAVPLPVELPLRFDFGMDFRVVAFTLFLSVGASLVAGIGPALQGSRSSLSAIMGGAANALRRGRRRPALRSVLVVGQVTTATLLVVGAGLALRSVQASATYDVGLNAERVAVMWKEPPKAELSPAELREYFLDLGRRVEAHPEVEAVALARTAEAYVLMEDFATALVRDAEGSPGRVRFNAVTPGYLDMMEIPLEQGRGIARTDAEGAPAVAVVNQAFVRRFLPEGPSLGARFQVSEWFEVENLQDRPPVVYEVVGIVEDPLRPAGEAVRPFFWISYLQDPPVRAILHVKARQNAAAAVPILRQEAPPAPDEITLIEPGPYQDLIAYRFLGHRMLSGVLAVAGVFALVLAFIGVFGIVSFTVTQRFREMAIRQAMGARKVEVWRRVVGYGLRTSGLGVALGLALAVLAGYLARHQLLGVAPADPLAVGGGTALLLLAALVAGLLPARRLAAHEPMDVLRED